MANITLKGNSINTLGNLPKTGNKAPNFKLTTLDLSEKSLSDFKGKKIILNIFPSIDTGTCATSVREFNKKSAELENTVVLCISRDLPFAQARFCGAEGIENVLMLSDFATGKFGKDFGYPKNIIKHNNGMKKNRYHPTQKPVDLMEYLIKTYTNENETVLDFTMGSGSTMVACQNTNRNGIGIEMDNKYFEIAKQRIKENEYKICSELASVQGNAEDIDGYYYPNEKNIIKSMRPSKILNAIINRF